MTARLLRGMLLGSAMLGASALPLATAHAQAAQSGNGAGWFVPKTAHPVAPPSQTSHRAPSAEAQASDDQQDGQDNQSGPPPVLPQPPIPTAPELPKAAAPPTAVIGIVSVSDIMRQSTAGQQVEHELGGRRDALAQDAQREQAGWRDEQQKLQAESKTMTSDQIQTRERALQARVMKAQHDFRERNRIIQEAAQVSLGQIERELIQVIQHVANSHSMNLVLHSEQVALHVDGQDITNEVAQQLNAVLPKVFVPAANVDPEVLAKSGKMPTTADAEQPAPSSIMTPVVKK